MKKKLVIFSDTYLKNSETFIYSQLTGLLSFFDITFLALNLTNQEKFPFESVEAVRPPFHQKIIRIINPFKLSRQYGKKIEEKLLQLKPDAVYVHFGTNAMKVAPIIKKLELPMLIIFHGGDLSKRIKDHRYSSLLEHWLPHFDFICVSRALEKRLEKFGPISTTKNHVQYIGVDIEKFFYSKRESIKSKLDKNESIRFLQVSRFVEKKGHKYTLEVFRKFLSRVEKPHLFRLQFIGNGPLEKEMKDYVRTFSIEENVEFLGLKKSEEIVEALQKADALLQHSVTASTGDTEGLPIGIMEAMSTGLPVISTYHSGIPELITDSVNGYLVNEKDTETYLEKLNALISSDIDFGFAGRKTIEEKFNLKTQNRLLSERILSLMN